MLSNYLKRSLSLLVIIGFVVSGCSAQAESELQQEEKDLIKLFERVSPSVAFIKNAALQWDWFSTYVYEIPRGAGSGFVWDDQGHIVTNFHVIYQANRIEVILSDHKPYNARIVGTAPNYDLAVLKIDAPKELLKPVSIGNSKSLRVGQKALSIGNPFGLDYSLTTGVVSALGRSMKSVGGRKIHDVIQTDAAINPGNSGGPLVNLRGEIIGINVAIFSTSGGYQGIGFAIPSNKARRILSRLIEGKKVIYGWLGVTVQDLTDELAEYFNLPDKSGVLVNEVVKDGPVDRAGVEREDVILSFEGKKLQTVQELLRAVGKIDVGNKIKLGIWRDKKKKSVVVKIGERPEDVTALSVELDNKNEEGAWRGISVKDIDKQATRTSIITQGRSTAIENRVDTKHY